jgi:hypothetical protein
MTTKSKKKSSNLPLRIALGAGVLMTALLARGMLPELVRYLRIRRM